MFLEGGETDTGQDDWGGQEKPPQNANRAAANGRLGAGAV